ncbi:MAG: cation transporter [Bacilli bacterium]|nr:cation transporter [Bacilli bacterium]
MSVASKNNNRDKIIVRTSFIGIIGNLFLVAFKLVIGLLVGSVSIISDALNNLADAASSSITIVGTKLANKRPDKKHPYGYGRIEYVTSLIIAALVIIAGASAISESLKNVIGVFTEDLWFKPRDFAAFNYAAIIIVSTAILVKIALGLYFRYVGKSVNSGALRASGTDALTDSILSGGTLVAAIIALTTSLNIEGFLGIAIGCFIVKSGIEILISSVGEIIGGRAEKEMTQKLRALVNSFDEVRGTYDITLNNYGPNRSIGSAHIEVDDDMVAKDIQVLSRKIVAKAYAELNVILTIGIYATNLKDPKAIKIKKAINKILEEYPTVMQLHGFYVNDDEMVISFDIVVSFEDKNPDHVRDEIKAKIERLYPKYKTSIAIDIDVSD